MYGKRLGLLTVCGAVLSFMCPPTAPAQQASLTLTNCDAQYCYMHENNWTLSKAVTGNTVQNGQGTITWTVMALKTSGPTTFTVHGGLTVTNTGSAPATIGNIVVNLQKPNSPKKGSKASHVSIAANVADATNGDAATTANIVAAASQENPATNAAWGVNNYTTSGGKGTFTETACSGTLEFTDASDNTIFSLVPQPVIAAGDAVTLLYAATFEVSCLPAAGTPLRVEVLVSFGNAGARGGSGASVANIDINGNGVIDADEGPAPAKVRTVPCRVNLAPLPEAPEECNDSVTVTDPEVDATGTVTWGNPVGFGAFPADISGDMSWDVSVDVDAGTDGGMICNTAYLNGQGSGGTLSVIVQVDTGYPAYDELGNQIGWYATFVCCEGAELSASACADIAAPTGFQDGDYCTYSQGGFQGGGYPGTLFDSNFIAVFPGGLTIGINDGGGPKHHALWNATVTGRTKLKTYLGGGGPSGSLTADTTDATSTSGGALAKQTATLTLNVGFNAAGVTTALNTNFGSLKLCNLVAGSTIGTWNLTAAQAAALNGASISQVLADANTALGGGGLPPYVGSFGDLNQLVTALNLSFHECVVSAFAAAYLCP